MLRDLYVLVIFLCLGKLRLRPDKFQKAVEVIIKMVKCDFCGATIEKGTGKIFIRDSGKMINFCTIKCEKFLLKYKKKPRNLI